MYEISFVDDDYEDFRIQDLLGEGSFAQVYKCVETKSQTVFALKEFDTKHKDFDEKSVEQEVVVWTDMIHENIVRLYASFTTGSYMYFVLEYVDGGSLFNHMMQRHKYSEKEAANIMKQVRFYWIFWHKIATQMKKLCCFKMLFCNPSSDWLQLSYAMYYCLRFLLGVKESSFNVLLFKGSSGIAKTEKGD